MKAKWLIMASIGAVIVGLCSGDVLAQQGRQGASGNRTGPQDGTGPRQVQARDGSGQQLGRRQGEGQGEYRKGQGQGQGWHRDGTGARVGNRAQLRDGSCER